MMMMMMMISTITWHPERGDKVKGAPTSINLSAIAEMLPSSNEYWSVHSLVSSDKRVWLSRTISKKWSSLATLSSSAFSNSFSLALRRLVVPSSVGVCDWRCRGAILVLSSSSLSFSLSVKLVVKDHIQNSWWTPNDEAIAGPNDRYGMEKNV